MEYEAKYVPRQTTNLIHSGIRKQQRRVIMGDNCRRVHISVLLLLSEELDERRADLVAAHELHLHSSPLFRFRVQIERISTGPSAIHTVCVQA